MLHREYHASKVIDYVPSQKKDAVFVTNTIYEYFVICFHIWHSSLKLQNIWHGWFKNLRLFLLHDSCLNCDVFILVVGTVWRQ